ncbi:hypothetical protein [Pseudomonas veronii]|uniref:hypothetical protein n=1 Tax=Pseudomonas veronii TaxID=76761 RepID=UPI0016805F9A|nr:hypothetical protein [Pseudomonas veronii]
MVDRLQKAAVKRGLYAYHQMLMHNWAVAAVTQYTFCGAVLITLQLPVLRVVDGVGKK